MYDIGIIGGGPAGYTAAIRAAQYGMKIVLFEKNDIGGTCLNKGCIPTKTILHSAQSYANAKNSCKCGVCYENISYNYPAIFARKNDVVQKIRKSLTQLISGYGIEIINFEAVIDAPNLISADDKYYECKNIIIATGSKPHIINLNADCSDDFIIDSDGVLNLENIPENILVVGSGAIGIEWTRIFSQLDKKVTLIELADKIIPIADIDVSNRIERILKRERIPFYTNTSIKSIKGNEVILSNDKIITTDCILLATGRSPVVPATSTNIEVDRFVITKENFETNIPNIYAIGDVNGISMLAHSAMHQAIELVEYINSKKPVKFDTDKVPSVIYGSPEIAWIGQTEQKLIESGIEYTKSMFPIAALGKACSDNCLEGFIKILVQNDKIAGAHIISSEASSLIQQIAIAIENNLSPKDLSQVIYAHPTYSEGIYEAILGLSNLAIHIPQQK